jgi:hypothetical protein
LKRLGNIRITLPEHSLAEYHYRIAEGDELAQRSTARNHPTIAAAPTHA